MMQATAHHPGTAWPPQARFTCIDARIRELLREADAAGVPESRYVSTWIEAAREILTRVALPSVWREGEGRRIDDGRSVATWAPDEITDCSGRARPSNLLGKVALLFGRFVRSLVPAFSATERAIALALGLGLGDKDGRKDPDPPGTRQVRTIVRQLELAGLVERFYRWEESQHEEGESRATVYVLRLSREAIGLLERVRGRRSRRLPLQGERAAFAPAPEPAPAAPSAAEGRPVRTSSATSPAAPASSWWLPIGREERARVYPGGPAGPNSVRDPARLAVIEGALEGAAGWCLAQLPARGVTVVPPAAEVRDELARGSMRAWLAEPQHGKQSHPLAWFAGDVARLADAEKDTWLRRWVRAHPPPPRAALPVEVLPVEEDLGTGELDGADVEEARAACAELRGGLPPANWLQLLERRTAEKLAEQERQRSAVVSRAPHGETAAPVAAVETEPTGPPDLPTRRA